MGVSAPDIITYIGVPLAVLGVLPILYTFFKALLTQNHVRREIRKNNIHHAATTSTSLMSGEVQLQLPRYTLTPPLRDSDDYWSREEQPSSLKGGTWTLFRWRRIVTGKVKYGLQLHDEIRQPAAEIEFEGLVTFLLDRGAVPDADGVRMLKTMGLMTPKNTPILVLASGGGTAAGAKRSVLVVSSPDDSEGHLVLKMFWSDKLMDRDVQDLPPYWTRVASFQREGGIVEEVGAEEHGDDSNTKEEIQIEQKEKLQDEDKAPGYGETSEKAAIPTSEKENESEKQETSDDPNKDDTSKTTNRRLKSVRMYIGPSGLEDARPETPEGRLDTVSPPLSISHLQSPAATTSYQYYPPSYQTTIPPAPSRTYSTSIPVWFPTLAITVLGEGTSGLWRYTIPPPIIAFSHRDSIPHGVLVWLSLLQFEETPMSLARAGQRRQKQMAKQQEDHREMMRAMQAENNLPAHLRDAARQKRSMDMSFKMSQRMTNDRLEREQERLDRKEEALVSPRVSNARVSEACLRYLQGLPPPPTSSCSNGEVKEEGRRPNRDNWKSPHDKHPLFTARTRQEVVEYALHLMLFDPEFADSVCGVLDKWKGWSEVGVMNDRQLDEIEADTVGFCFAGVLLQVVAERVGARETWAGADLADVQTAWRTVWLE